MKFKSLVFAFGLLVAGSAFADDTSSGCGYGWEITKEKTLVASLTRNTTNSVASNTIAMTMGTSGCEKHDIVKAGKAQEVFAEVNYESIMADMAAGQGEYLSAFAEVMGCDAAALSTVGQQNFEGIAADNGRAFLQNVRTQISNNASLKAACI